MTQPARLIPVSGISGNTEAEMRATSALLSVLTVVRPFSKALLAPLGATRADRAIVDALVEVTYDQADGTTVRPDGYLCVSYGRQDPFEALVEVKTGDANLDADQINAYWDIARAEGYDAVITISNEIAPAPGVHPTSGLRVRSNSKAQVHHLSWALILAEAVKEHAHRGVDDPEQAWILGELIRYLEHPNSGALAFADMGANWVAIRDGARDSSLDRRDRAVVEICQRWDQLMRYCALRLGADIGSDVQEVIPKAHRDDPSLRNRSFVESLCTDATLAGTLRVPDTIGDIEVSVDLKAKRVIVQSDFDAPSDRGAKARVSWLTRQLPEASGSTMIEAFALRARTPVTATLDEAREDSTALFEGRREPVKFRVCQRTEMGEGRKTTRKPGFVDSVLAAVTGFYGDVLQDLQAAVQRAPRLERQPREPEPVTPDPGAHQTEASSDADGTIDQAPIVLPPITPPPRLGPPRGW